jgi:dTDP-glucose pyrophosphorylase
MAGEGSRFREAGYETPKPFIRIGGRPMVSLVVENLSYTAAQFLLIARQEHAESDPKAVSELTAIPNLDFHFLDDLTEGTACTVLEACDNIILEHPLLIANSDQLVRHGVKDMLDDAFDRGLDGSIMVFPADGDPKWSYARLDETRRVIEVAEKKAISNLATVGIYYFKTAGQFFESAKGMMSSNDRVNGEFYTCPVYNYLIGNGGVVGAFEIDPTWMSGLGTPEDVEKFIETELVHYARPSL